MFDKAQHCLSLFVYQDIGDFLHCTTTTDNSIGPTAADVIVNLEVIMVA